MNKPDYTDRGSISINRNFDPATREQFKFRGTITAPNETDSQRLNYRVTPSGALNGFVQPANDEEVIAREQFKASVAQGVVPEGAAQGPHVDLTLREDQGKDGKRRIVPIYVYKDVLIGGAPLELLPNQVCLFSGKAHTDKFDQGVADGTIDPTSAKRPPRWQGFAANINGVLTEPAAFERQAAVKDKAGKPVFNADGTPKMRSFYSGDNKPVSFEAIIQRRQDKEQAAGDGPAVSNNDASMDV